MRCGRIWLAWAVQGPLALRGHCWPAAAPTSHGLRRQRRKGRGNGEDEVASVRFMNCNG